MGTNYYRRITTCLSFAAVALCCLGATAQEISLKDLSAFKSPSPNWQLASKVVADPNLKYDLSPTPGAGVLVNLPKDPKQSKDIYTIAEHGDADIEMEFLMAKESNSGIYLQARYEIQLLDSWGKKNAAAGDCGGIYERWDDKRPQGQMGYQGYAPRQNASRIAGVWQKIKISFQAPRFDKSGRKTENARILSIYLNDVLIHENVELTGPTRAGLNNDEVPRGPIRIQGDHGPIAFRNMVIRPYDTAKPVLKNLTYIVHDGRVLKKEELSGLKASSKGKAEQIDYAVAPLANDFAVQYKGIITVPVKGKYRFNGDFWGGYGDLEINGKPVIPFSWHRDSREIELPAGDLPFVYTYAKVNEGDKPGFGLTVSGPGIRPVRLNAVGSINASRTSNPIEIEAARETVVHRSFISFNGKTLPYGVSVGTNEGVNYSMNLANGAMLRTWRGPFLNATPMWLDRGNGVSLPLGSVLDFTETPQMLKVAGKDASDFLLKGYGVDENNLPDFRYLFNGSGFHDKTSPDSSGKYLNRTVTADNTGTEFQFTLAGGKQFDEQSGGLILVDGKYFIKILEGGKPTVIEKDGGKMLTVTAKDKLVYSIIW